MTTQGWVVMVGVRVLDVALLVGWLVWFFRLRDEGDDTGGGSDGGGGPKPSSEPPSPGGPRLALPLPDAGPWRGRLRDHGSGTPRHAFARRGTPVRPARTPAGRPVHRG
jgi:hypothetical protein